MDVEAIFLTDLFVQDLAQKGGDVYDMMGKIIKAEGLFLIWAVLLN